MLIRYRLTAHSLRPIVRSIRTQTLHEQTLNHQSNTPYPRPPGLGLATPREVCTCHQYVTHRLMLLLANGVPQSIHRWAGDSEEGLICRVSTMACHPFPWR